MITGRYRKYLILQHAEINELEKMGFGRPNNVLHARKQERNRLEPKAQQKRPASPLSKRKKRKGGVRP